VASFDDLSGEPPQRPKELSLTSEARTARDELLSGCIAQLEQTPTVDLPSEALRRLALLVNEVAGSTPLASTIHDPAIDPDREVGAP